MICMRDTLCDRKKRRWIRHTKTRRNVVPRQNAGSKITEDILDKLEGAS